MIIKQHPKLLISICFFITTVFMLSSLPAFAITNYEQQYDVAIGFLYDLQKTENLDQALQMLNELGTYRNAKLYKQYVSAVRALNTGDLQQADDILSVLSRVPDFTSELNEKSFPSCEDLIAYGKARSLEDTGKYAESLEIYITCNVLDSVDRAVMLRGKVMAASTTAPFTIAVQYTPAPTEEKAFSDQKLFLEAANQDSGIYLTWNNLEGISEYEIYWRRTKETKKPFVKVSKLIQNSFTHTAEPRNGFKYSYYVEAVSASGQQIKSNEVQIVCRSGGSNGNQKDNKTRRATPQDPGRTAQPQVTPSSGQGTGHRSPGPFTTPQPTQAPADNNDGGSTNPLLNN